LPVQFFVESLFQTRRDFRLLAVGMYVLYQSDALDANKKYCSDGRKKYSAASNEPICRSFDEMKC
jgi:hypothetical protein